MVVDTTMWVLHVVFAGLWTGSILFVAGAVMPPAYRGEIDGDLLGELLSKLQRLTRVSAVAFLVTGAHMVGSRYTGIPPEFGALIARPSGHTVLAMFVLWIVATGLVEAGSGRARTGLDRGKLREPARNARRLFQGAAAVAVLLLITAGVLAAGV
ncbi:MAG: transporter [Haloferacaceae archaeon]